MMLEKASESLAAAELCHVHQYHNSSASRSYYAAFQAAIYALSHAGIESSESGWSHAGLQATFTRELIQRRKIYTSEFARTLHNLHERRLIADYDQAGVSARVAAKVLSDASAFVQRVKEVTSR